MKSIENLKQAVKQLQNGERTCIGCAIRQVEKDLQREMKAVDFYADKENWTSDNMYAWSDGKSAISFGDKESLFDDGNTSDCRGGKLARETQRKRK